MSDSLVMTLVVYVGKIKRLDKKRKRKKEETRKAYVRKVEFTAAKQASIAISWPTWLNRRHLG